MKKFSLIVLLVLALPIVAVACGENLQPQVGELEKELAALEKELAELEETTGPPPAFLDSLYPPQAPAPVYLIEMMALDQAFSIVLIS